jgi:predicted metal-dependent phosphotriesterase family hydrolase
MPQVMTVTGSIDPGELGHVQPHEHVFSDLTQARHRWDFACLEDAEQMTQEVEAYSDAGGRTLVDVTPLACGRDPRKLVRVAQATGVHIVMGVGWYREPYYPPEVFERTTNYLAGRLIDEITHGFEDTGIKPGIIGEIGLDKKNMHAAEERAFRAAGRAHRSTGLAISVHTPPHTPEVILEVLREEGVDPARVIFGHMDNTLELDYFESVLKAGSVVELDLIGIQTINTDQRRADLVVKLVERGYQDRILLSQDLYTRDRLKSNGGHGYGYLIETFLPRLTAAGLGQDVIHQLTQTNPQRLLAV